MQHPNVHQYFKDILNILLQGISCDFMNTKDRHNSVSMKQARVKPLYKKNCSLDVSYYRPVSILSVVFKILERCVYN